MMMAKGNESANRPGESERQHNFRQLEHKEMRQVTGRHLSYSEQFPGIHLSPGLFEKRVEVFGGADRIEWRQHRPRPQQSHDQVTDHESRD